MCCANINSLSEIEHNTCIYLKTFIFMVMNYVLGDGSHNITHICFSYYHLWNFKSVFIFYCFFPPNSNTHSVYVLCVCTIRLNNMYKNVPWCILTKKRRKRWIQLPWMNMLGLHMEKMKSEIKVGSLKFSTFYKNQWKKVKKKKSWELQALHSSPTCTQNNK